MTRKTVTLSAKSGADVSTAALLVQVASQYSSSVYLITDSKKINAKSIMGMMSMNFSKDEKFDVCAEGADEADAVQAIETFAATGKH